MQAHKCRHKVGLPNADFCQLTAVCFDPLSPQSRLLCLPLLSPSLEAAPFFSSFPHCAVGCTSFAAAGMGCSAPPPPSARACCCSHPCSCCLVLQLMGRVTALVSPPLQPVWRLPPNQPEEAGDATEVTLFSHPPCCFRQS